MMMTRFEVASLVVVGALALAVDLPEAAAQSCPATSVPTSWAGSFLNTDTTKSGTTFNPSSSGRIELSRNAETFATEQLSATSDTVYLAVADFNKDGWVDFVGAPQNKNGPLNVFANFTWQNENCTTAACTAHAGTACVDCAPGQPPDFTNPAVVIVPKFTNVRTLGNYTGTFFDSANCGGTCPGGRFSLAAADFNGDSWPDIFSAFAMDTNTDAISAVDMYLNTGVNDGSGNPQFGARYTANAFTPINTVLGNQKFSGTNIKAVDYNADGRMDILIGQDKSNGSIRILLNNCPGTLQGNGIVLCSANPTFTDGGYLIFDLNVGNDGFGTGNGSTPIFDYADIDLDGFKDLIVGAANCCTAAAFRARMFKGCSGGAGCTAGLENTSTQNLAFVGAATAVMITDFSLDGRPDVVLATDGGQYDASNALVGGTSFYYRNNGTTTPFSAGATQQLTVKGGTPPQQTDFDVGAFFDYDKDPNSTADLVLANGNTAGGYNVIANRLTAVFVNCGEAFSSTIDLGALADDELVVTSARLTPTFAANSGTVTFWASNEEPPNWVQANLCTSSTTDYCVSFPKPIGHVVRWKAVLCSNSPGHNATPNVSGMNVKFDYTTAKEHYRAGTIVNDGIAYVGAFGSPGDRGKFYAINAGLTEVYWDAASKLDAMADGNRRIYTSPPNLATRIEFSTAEAANPLLQSLLQTPDTTATTDLITWIRSARFGVGTVEFPLQRLGSIETSTPAILIKPGRPSYYSFVTALDRQRIDTFVTAKANRKPLVMFGAKDGMIHALHTRPSETPANSINGTEAWAFIPPTVAAGMLSDKTATFAANAALNNGTNNPTISSYPDGSPTLADIHAGSGVFKSIAVVAEGNGGKSVTVLDVTETIDPATDVVLGPTPMWSATPGDSEAGKAFAKPAVTRVLIANQERYFVVAATGIDFTDTLGEKGRVVSAYDALTGELMWKFQTKCPVTSDIVAFETDDTAEPGAPTLNGFTDRVIFSDKCGYVYKLAPGIDLDGGFYDNTGFGTILANTTTDGKKQYALFSTKDTTNALGVERPIAGTIAARTDNSTRMVLFFGTGGLEQVAAAAVNQFYAVYADTGAIRTKLVGDCTPAGCEKFYGGIIVTPEKVLFTRTIDPVIGSSTCDTGTTKLSQVNLNDDTAGNFVGLQDQLISSAVMGGLFGDAGAVYFATLSGDIVSVGVPRTTVAGGDTASGITQGTGIGDYGTGSGSAGGTTTAYTLLGWRVVL